MVISVLSWIYPTQHNSIKNLHQPIKKARSKQSMSKLTVDTLDDDIQHPDGLLENHKQNQVADSVNQDQAKN